MTSLLHPVITGYWKLANTKYFPEFPQKDVDQFHRNKKKYVQHEYIDWYTSLQQKTSYVILLYINWKEICWFLIFGKKIIGIQSVF